MSSPAIIGIAGQLRAGKDTIAKRLVARWGYTRIGLADALKAEVRVRFRHFLLAYAAAVEGVGAADVEGEEATLNWLLETKDSVIRALLQEYGTEVRRAEDPDYWIKAWERRALPALTAETNPRLVVPDVRFRNEADFMASYPRGGVVVQVTRPGFVGDTHASERDLDGWNRWDHRFANDGNVAGLEAQVDRWIES